MSSLVELTIESTLGEISSAEQARIEELYLASAYPVREREPRIVAAAGNIAAGKTSILRFLSANGELQGSQAVRHDPDAVMAELEGYRTDTLVNPLSAFRRWEVPARRLAENILIRAIERRCDIVYDRTCAFPETVALLKRLREACGYRITMYFVWASLDECIRRSKLRARVSRRHVPEEIIVQRAEALRSLLPQYAGVAHEFIVYENHDGSGPRLVAELKNGSVARCVDESAFANFCSEYAFPAA